MTVHTSARTSSTMHVKHSGKVDRSKVGQSTAVHSRAPGTDLEPASDASGQHGRRTLDRPLGG